MATNQRIPLRTLSESVNGQQTGPRGNNSANAPSIGRAGSIGSPISTQIDSFLVANDCITVDSNSAIISSAGVYSYSILDQQFPNIPITQNNSATPQPLVGVGNQTFPFTSPQNMLAEYYVWCSLAAPAHDVVGNTVAAIVVPWCVGYAVDSSGTKYQNVVRGLNQGQQRLPSGIVFNAFKVSMGVQIYAPASLGLPVHFTYKVFGQLFLTYPSANPS